MNLQRYKINMIIIFIMVNLFLCMALPINNNKNNNTVFDISYKGESISIFTTFIFYSFVIELSCVLTFLYFFIMCIKR
jgi:hypothetical protein